jgi:hypothetical protein
MTGSADAEDPPTRVEVPDGQGVQVGDHGAQHNKYIQTYIETQVIQQSAAEPLVAGIRLPGNVPRMLGQVRAARELDQDTLDRRRRALGEDHPDTLTTANNLAADLRALRDVDDEP